MLRVANKNSQPQIVFLLNILYLSNGTLKNRNWDCLHLHDADNKMIQFQNDLSASIFSLQKYKAHNCYTMDASDILAVYECIMSSDIQAVYECTTSPSGQQPTHMCRTIINASWFDYCLTGRGYIMAPLRHYPEATSAQQSCCMLLMTSIVFNHMYIVLE